LAARFAAIDVGSNAIRLVIGEQDSHGDVKVLKKLREPVRLGKDVFANGSISEKSREQIVRSFLKFREMIEAYEVNLTRAVATSAVRECRDNDLLVEQIRRSTNIQIEVIDGLEEGNLIFSAVSHRVDLHEKVSLLIDIGGGSVELTIADHGKPIACQSFRLGTVRLLQRLQDRGLKEKHLRSLIEEDMGAVRDFLRFSLKGLHIDQAIGTGGNFECLGKLRVALLQRSSIFSMTRDELGRLVEHLESMTMKERIQFLRLRPDRADVVIPAALVSKAVMDCGEIDLLNIPYVGLRDGILNDLATRALTVNSKAPQKSSHKSAQKLASHGSSLSNHIRLLK
jgi:exopolyphosphatase/guanosine-5'-triphosphate,3'-diphosphate pyrophosphatase